MPLLELSIRNSASYLDTNSLPTRAIHFLVPCSSKTTMTILPIYDQNNT